MIHWVLVWCVCQSAKKGEKKVLGICSFNRCSRLILGTKRLHLQKGFGKQWEEGRAGVSGQGVRPPSISAVHLPCSEQAEQPLGAEKHAIPSILHNLATSSSIQPTLTIPSLIYFLGFGGYHGDKRICSPFKRTALEKIELEKALTQGPTSELLEDICCFQS